ncbi:type VI secretion system protein ImpE [Panacagrimonas perspica]|uniref:Type VI secretion system protein ImpE n=1 Tax=Panacagrimonas perspica TaxID=381431 RepID=A0A4R7PCC9_9GAMM|nr:type VI secretion system accessory protein TagJ [Panacagrimonas perspica]TDU31181.1 type VI secretion system protein ImpE [Panacagrimonas perspica]THD01053.1 virulence protein SciE type [Panacagrimonas perspica]
MNATPDAETLLKSGDPAGALAALQTQVRSKASDAKLRVFLFQLLCVQGQWERALNQLNLCAEMDAAALPMREMYTAAIGCELVRREVFSGRKSPMLFGEPQAWLALLIESQLRAGAGEADAATRLRAQAFEEAPATTGKIDGEAFSWIADADTRLGPVLEAIVNGRYYWIPFSRLTKLTIEAPTDLRDCIWLPANLQFSNGGEVLAMLPVRYPGSEASSDGLIALSRKTVWEESADGGYHGLGQRLLGTDNGEYPLLQVREILFDTSPET